ncbi:Adhesin/invasin TibA autotransporter [Bienertia sinuspersici]
MAVEAHGTCSRQSTTFRGRPCFNNESIAVIDKNGEGVTRVNTDAAIHRGVDAGFGAVLRDENGRVLAVGICKVRGLNHAHLAEVLAARFEVASAATLGYDKVELECDDFVLAKEVKL